MSTPFRLDLLRIWLGPKATMGELYVNGKLTCMTLELPWRDDVPGGSSIPEGKYGAILRYDKSRDGFFTIQLEGTGPRTGIQIHVGNRPDEISGCILLGLSAKFREQFVGKSKEAISLLRRSFYGTNAPNATPNLELSVSVSSLPRALRFYPSASDKSFFWVFDSGYWNGVGGTNRVQYTEIVRDASWIISKSETGGAFNGRYVRWGTLGGTPFQVSKDLKNWTTLAPDEMLVRDPPPNIPLWRRLASYGISLRELVDERTQGTAKRKLDAVLFEAEEAPGDGYGDDDGREDGRISYDFDDPTQPDYEGPEEITVDLDDSDTSDDYSDYDRDYGEDGGGGEGGDGGGGD